MKEITPFSTSIWYEKLPDFGLTSHIQNLRDNDTSNIVMTNSGGWHSPVYSGIELQDFLRPALLYMGNRLKYIYTEHGYNKDPELTNYWFNINKKYNYNNEHAHPFSIFSAVLYVKVPKDSGNIVFRRPDVAYHYTRPDVNNSRNYLSYWLEAEPNLFVVFPSYLFHSVSQNLTDEKDDERISIAFNFA